jgi:hypothetical protein
MRRFCGSIGAHFIVVDIPRPGASYELVASLPAGLVKQVEFVSSRELLGEFDGAVELHVPHGHRHTRNSPMRSSRPNSAGAS